MFQTPQRISPLVTRALVQARRGDTSAKQLLDEARDVQLSASAIRKLPKNDSLLSRLVGKLTK